MLVFAEDALSVGLVRWPRPRVSEQGARITGWSGTPAPLSGRPQWTQI